MITTIVCIAAGIFVCAVVSMALAKSTGPTKFERPKPGDKGYLYPYHDL